MSRAAVLSVLTAAALGVAATAGAGQSAEVKKGMEVYNAQHCSLCHSINGKGNAKGSLDDVGTKLKPEEIREWIVNPKEMTTKTKATRKPPMKQYNLPKEDVDALVAYIQTLKKK
ncbi:MAG: c-type cytochrome [Betaproteobacteria bacterium]